MSPSLSSVSLGLGGWGEGPSSHLPPRSSADFHTGRKVLRKKRERGPSAIDPNVGGVLTIYTNHPVGNLVQKDKTIRFDEVGERAATKYLQISVKNGFASNHSPVF